MTTRPESAPNAAGGTSLEDRDARKTPRIVAITGGKGGVGKSLLSSSISIYLAQLSRRVVLIDTNLGSSNLHTLLGVHEPSRSLHRFLRKDVRRLDQVITPTPFRGLGLIAGQANGVGAANPRPTQKKRLLSQLRSLEADYVVLDVAAGTSFNELDTLLEADLHVVVTQPEPTAVESAFRLIKSAFVRKVQRADKVGHIVARLECNSYCGIPTPNQLREAARQQEPEIADVIESAMKAFRPLLIINKTRTREDLEFGPMVTIVARRHLGLPVSYLGYVESDDVVWACVRQRRPVLVEHPEGRVSRDIERIARRLVTRDAPNHKSKDGLPTPFDRQNHYEILDLQPAATDEEIRRAHRRVRRLYDPASSAICGIVPPDEAERVLARTEEAYSTLIDPEKQLRYRQSLAPQSSNEAGIASANGSSPPPSQDKSEVDADSPHEQLPHRSAAGQDRPDHDHAQQETLETETTQHVASEGDTERDRVAPPGSDTEQGDTAEKQQPRPSMPPLDATTIYTGDLLRNIREAKGVNLRDLAEYTKISVTYLQSIEAEHFDNAPAPVYVRGFVKAVAKHLGLEVERVATSYMQRYETTHTA